MAQLEEARASALRWKTIAEDRKELEIKNTEGSLPQYEHQIVDLQ